MGDTARYQRKKEKRAANPLNSNAQSRPEPAPVTRPSSPPKQGYQQVRTRAPSYNNSPPPSPTCRRASPRKKGWNPFKAIWKGIKSFRDNYAKGFWTFLTVTCLFLGVTMFSPNNLLWIIPIAFAPVCLYKMCTNWNQKTEGVSGWFRGIKRAFQPKKGKERDFRNTLYKVSVGIGIAACVFLLAGSPSFAMAQCSSIPFVFSLVSFGTMTFGGFVWLKTKVREQAPPEQRY